MKANESLDFNLEKARELVERVGYELTLKKLESMRVYRWVGCENSVFCQCVICEIVDQISYEKLENQLSQELTEEVEISEIVPGDNGLFTVRRRVAQVQISEPLTTSFGSDEDLLY